MPWAAQAQQSDVCHVEAEIARLKAHKEDEARVAEQRHKEALAWCVGLRWAGGCAAARAACAQGGAEVSGGRLGCVKGWPTYTCEDQKIWVGLDE